MAQLSPADLLQPKGDITPDWFPKLDSDGVTELLQGYLDDAYARIPDSITSDVTRNNAARAWAMGRSWRNVLQRLINTPASFKVENEASQSIIADQIKSARIMAEKYESDFAGLTDVADAGASDDDAGQGAALNTVIW